MKNKFTPDPKFASSPICIEDADFDLSVDLSLISTVKLTPFMAEKMAMLLHALPNSLSWVAYSLQRTRREIIMLLSYFLSL